jgi:hypothetical protein
MRRRVVARKNSSGSRRARQGWGGGRKGAGAKKKLDEAGQKAAARFYRRRARIRRREHEHEFLPRAPNSKEFLEQQNYLRTLSPAERSSFLRRRAELESHTDEREKIALRRSGRPQAQISATRKRRREEQQKQKMRPSSDLYVFRERGGWQAKAIADTRSYCAQRYSVVLSRSTILNYVDRYERQTRHTPKAS